MTVRRALAATAVVLGLASPAAAAPVPAVEALSEGATDVLLDGSGTTLEAGRTVVAATWSTGDGATAQGLVVRHAFPAAGRYPVTLTVVDDAGESGAVTLDVVAGPLHLSFAGDEIQHGDELEVAGAFGPGAAGASIVLERDDGAGYRELTRALADAAGAFTASVSPRTSGRLRARVDGTASVGPATAFAVTPAVRLRRLDPIAFVPATVSGSVAPRSYTGTVRVVIRRRGEVVGRGRGAVVDGRLTATATLPGIGNYTIEVLVPGRDGLVATTAALRARADARQLVQGAQGPDVKAFLDGLASLRFRVPARRTAFGDEALDAVYAFQKAYGLPRTGRVSDREWRLLARARPLVPRFRAPGNHIEVDKTRQVLLVVERSQVAAVIPVSTGATGNTPEGRHRIRWKAPATSTWLGSAILYRTLTFVGNNFAIHGYPSVPPYPASHGCVRVPIWTADWLYRRSPVGETVYVYR